MSAPQNVYRIRDWADRFENNRTRELKTMMWRPEYVDASDVYLEVVTHEDGAAHYGVLTALRNIASRGTPRGYLIREDGRPHDAKSLSLVSRMPETLISAFIERALTIGELELGTIKGSKAKRLKSHLPAVVPHEYAGKPPLQEGNGMEGHHHQKREERKEERKEETRQESDRAPAALNVPAAKSTAKSKAFSLDGSDDDDRTPDGEVHQIPEMAQQPQYASATDEIKAIFKSKAGEDIPLRTLDSIRVALETNGIDEADFIAEVRKHVPNHWRNPAGFLLDFSKKFRTKTRKAAAAVTAEEAAEAAYRCARCSSRTRGRGLLLQEGGKVAACSCAAPEYIAEMISNGTITARTVQ